MAQSNAADDQIQRQSDVISGAARKINSKSHYLFFLHGKIVEDAGIRPTSPKYGVYEYEKILDTFKNAGFTVISEPRPKDTDIQLYAGKVVEQIKTLLKAGVPSSRITVVGASKGSVIAMLISTYLKNKDVNFVLMSNCNDSIFNSLDIDLWGNILSIYDVNDEFGQTCQKFFDKAMGINEKKEIELKIGTGHGILYQPLKEWVEPTISWARMAPKADKNSKLKRELTQSQQAVDEAENKKDFAALDRLLTDNYVFTAPTGVISTKKQLIEELKRDGESEAGQTLSYDEMKVYAYGNTALVNCRLTVRGKDKDGKDYTNRYRNTVIWVKQQKRWRMAGIHVNRIKD